MGTNSVNKIPSRSLPFVDKQGRIDPTWYEYLRKFIADSAETTGSSPAVTVNSIVAGAGLTSTTSGNTVTLAVGAGNALAVNANDVALDINNLSQVQGTLDDEIVISQPANNNSIKKTRLRDVAGLSSPGGAATQIQYNDNGNFGGDTGFFTDGAGAIDIVGTLDVDNVSIDGNTIATTNTNGDLVLDANGTGSINVLTHMELDSNIYIYGVGATVANGPRIQAVSNSVGLSHSTAAPQVDFLSGSANNGNFLMQLANSGNVRFTSDDTGIIITRGSGQLPLRRGTTASITASTTQSQGQGALTNDINEVSTCANANDTVTLPVALAGRHCLVINNGAQTLQVFPASGDNLGAGVDTSTTIVSGSRKWFVAFDSTNWEPVV